MAKRLFLLIGVLSMLAACEDARTGPVAISAIGAPPRLLNPNLNPLDSPSAIMAEAVAQGLVRFDAAGEIEPALAQSWIVSDDGLRYTFRIRRGNWADGSRITADQVVERLRAAASRASRNPLKPVLGGIESITAMTDAVLEISLRGPRPNLLQLLAQPEMAIIGGARGGSGPYQLVGEGGGAARLAMPRGEDGEPPPGPAILLRGERAAAAVARFAGGEADLVVGGTIGDLAVARAADQPNNRLIFDPVQGLFGLAVASREGPLGDPAVRRALSMAIDREGLAAAFNVQGMEARNSLVPAGMVELPRPLAPDWAAMAAAERQARARATIAALGLAEPPRLRVALPDGPGYRVLFAHLRRDWHMIGVEAVRVRPEAEAELRLIDAVAPAVLATWYLRHFTCDSARICDPEADRALTDARAARTMAERRLHLATADRILTGLTPYIPLSTPVRWSLVSQRLTGFRPNPFARHAVGELIAERF
jgi:peptide/nickel transport system substrate-binding protein